MRIPLASTQPFSNYIKFWISQSLSLLGSGLTFPLLQLIAAVLLQANAAQIGFLVAVASLPSLLLGLFAGAWVDRQKRRPLLIVADLGRFLLLLLLTLRILRHTLHIEQLYIGAFLAGILTLVSDVAYRSYLPSLVHRTRLLEANSHFEVSQSATETGGPGIAGALMQICTAPFALVLGAFAFLVSASMVATLPDVEPDVRQTGDCKPLLTEIHDGLQLVLTNRYLRAIMASIATIGLFYSMLETVFLLHMTREFGFEPGLISVVFTGGGIGFSLAAWLTRSLVQRFGFGLVLMGSLLVLGLGNLILALSLNTKMSVLLVLVIGYTLFGFGHTTYNIAQVSLRQAVTPNHLQGRMNATMEFALWGIAPIGALFGGFIGEWWGINTVIWITAVGQAAGICWLYFSPIRALRVHLPPVATIQPKKGHSSLV
ncbi:MAG: MFS transporter [Caldilineaceae bacterium]